MSKISKIKVQNTTYDIKDLLSVHGDGIENIVTARRSVYDAIPNKDDETLYIVYEPVEAAFGGLQIAGGPLAYENGAYVIKDGWNYDSYNSVYGKNNGSTYFNFLEMGELFDHSDFSTSDGDIENILNPLDGWRLPTQSEIISLLSGTRDGSTVNGNSGSKYALIALSGVTYAGSSFVNGLLIFPDNKEISGKTLDGINDNTQTTGVTLSELNAYMEQGCTFIPAAGYRDSLSWKNGGYNGGMLSSTEYSEFLFYSLDFDDLGIYYSSDHASGKGDWFLVYLVRSEEDIHKSYKLYKGEELLVPDTSAFITRAVGDLANYYLKSETYTKMEVDTLIGTIQQFHYEVYASTSAVVSPSGSVLYLIGPNASDIYDEYVYDGGWIKIGDTTIDLSDYVTFSELDSYYTKQETDTLIEDKPDFVEENSAEQMMDAYSDILKKLYEAIDDTEAEARNAVSQANAAMSAASTANTSAINANMAAGNADVKAALAENKATLANQKAQYAETQGDYAKAQGDMVAAIIDDVAVFVEDSSGTWPF